MPFDQLYQLCRKVLTPAEQAAEEVSYGPETILYYNTAVYKQHPTPADVSTANHYLINTTTFESPDGSVLLGLLHLQAQITHDLAIEAEAFTCSVLLNPYNRQQRSTVRVNFAQVWQVLRSDSPQVNLEEIEEAGGLLYDAPEVLSTYARQGRLA